MDENNEYVNRSAFNKNFMQGSLNLHVIKKDISMAGKQYKVKIDSLIR